MIRVVGMQLLSQELETGDESGGNWEAEIVFKEIWLGRKEHWGESCQEMGAQYFAGHCSG